MVAGVPKTPPELCVGLPASRVRPGAHDADAPQPNLRLRQVSFALGDCIFLMTVGVLAAAAMLFADTFECNGVLRSFAGMALAMLVQTLLALIVAPLLGSIETMTPSMVVAMGTPMILEAWGMLGLELAERTALPLGAALGLFAFLLLELYGVRCRTYFQRTYSVP